MSDQLALQQHREASMSQGAIESVVKMDFHGTPEKALEKVSPQLNTIPHELIADIARFLPLGALRNLTLVCRKMAPEAQKALYMKDASDENRAICWGARCGTQDEGIQIVKHSLHNGGNLNARHDFPGGFTTALHLAVAYRRHDVVTFLLDNGANPNANAKNLGHMFPSVHTILDGLLTDRPTRQAVHSLGWKPLFIPIVKGDYYTAALLISRGAVPALTQLRLKTSMDLPHAGAETLVHINHVLAMHPRIQFSSDVLAVQARNLNLQMVRSLSTPLHLAVGALNVDMVAYLIELGAALDKFDKYGNTPLHKAVAECTRGVATERRMRLQMASMLLEAGADPNLRRLTQNQETPLHLIADKVKYEWAKSHVHIKEMVQLLVEAGADLNMAESYSGKTVLHHLWQAVRTSNGNRNQALAQYTSSIIERGADPNIAIVTRTQPPASLLALSILEPGTSRFYWRLLERAGALLQHGEAKIIFYRWATWPDWPSKYPAIDLRNKISQEAVNTAIMDSFCTPDARRERFMELYTQCTFTGDWNEVLETFLRVGVRGKLPPIPFPFEPTLTSGGDTYIHICVRALGAERLGRMMEARAAADVKHLIRLGVPVDVEDANGLTALKLLLTYPMRYPELQRVLERASE